MNFANESEYKFIQQDKDGKFYLTEQAVIDLANYIKQLQDLNNNYKAQIENLKAQIANLEKQILNLEQQVKTLEEENRKLQQELAFEKTKKVVWNVVAVISIGATIYLFIK
jgi:phage shock protein A